MESVIQSRAELEPDELEVLDQFDRTHRATIENNGWSISEDRFEIFGVRRVGISAISAALSEESFSSFTRTIEKLISNNRYSPVTLAKRVKSFNHFLEIIPTKEITVLAVSTLLENCKEHNIDAVSFRNIKVLLLRWYEYQLPGVGSEVIDFLNRVKLPKPKSPPGSKVRSDDPTEGWYTEEEYSVLVDIIWSDYESGANSLFNTAALLLSAQYGRRLVQIAQLKIKDLQSSGSRAGVTGRRVEFPGAKDQLASDSFRQSKVEVHPVGKELWDLCQLQASEVTNECEECLGRKLTDTEKQLLPLFPRRDTHGRHTKAFNMLKESLEQAKTSTEFKECFASSLLHTKPDSITARGTRNRYDYPISERTGEVLIQNIYRFRYTRARQLARMGVSRAVLQHWLGHSGDRSLDNYYDDPAERARKINDKIRPLMAPLAQAFRGMLCDSENDAIRGDDPASRIEVDGREDLTLGNCGEHGFCSASVPIPCYRCSKFQPWVYGPHQEVLDRLKARQEKENEVPLIYGGKRLLLPVQLDKDIKAVEEVIRLCEQRQQELGADHE